MVNKLSNTKLRVSSVVQLIDFGYFCVNTDFAKPAYLKRKALKLFSYLKQKRKQLMGEPQKK